VVGVEAQANWTNLKGSASCASTANLAPFFAINLGVPSSVTQTQSCNVKIDSMGTVAARLGYALDRLLLFGKIGTAWTNDAYQSRMTTFDVNGNPTAPLLFSSNETRWGFMLGAGIEYAFLDNWSAKIEYNYMDLGTRSNHFNDVTGTIFLDTDIRERINVVKVGINYRLGASPIYLER
jgi:outer membrane immunogenic protein